MAGAPSVHVLPACPVTLLSPFLRKSLGMELLLLRVPFPRRLLINRIGSFWATASIDAGLGGASLYDQGTSNSVFPPRELEQDPPIPRTPARPLARGDAGPSFTHTAPDLPPTHWPALHSALAGAAGCSISPLPCPATAPSLRPGIRREAGLAQHAPPPL